MKTVMKSLIGLSAAALLIASAVWAQVDKTRAKYCAGGTNTEWCIDQNGDWVPTSDGNQSIGSSSLRLKDMAMSGSVSAADGLRIGPPVGGSATDPVILLSTSQPSQEQLAQIAWPASTNESSLEFYESGTSTTSPSAISRLRLSNIEGPLDGSVHLFTQLQSLVSGNDLIGEILVGNTVTERVPRFRVRGEAEFPGFGQVFLVLMDATTSQISLPAPNVVVGIAPFLADTSVGMHVGGDIKSNAGLKIAGPLNVGRDASQSAVQESTTVAASGSYIVVQSSGGAVTLTSTPNISTATAEGGDVMYIQGDSDTNTVTLQDEGNLTDSGLEFAGSVNRTLGAGDTLHMIFDSGTSVWREVSYSDN